MKQIQNQNALEDSASLCETKIKGLQAKLQQKTWNATSFALFECVWQDLSGETDTHSDIKIVFIFAQVAFLGVSHMTCGSETRDTKMVVRERVKHHQSLASGLCGSIRIERITHKPPTSTLPIIGDTRQFRFIIILKLLPFIIRELIQHTQNWE